MGNKEMQCEELPKPEAEGTNVVIRVRAAALCGTDLAAYSAPPDKTLSVVPGHEIAGEVVDVDYSEHVKIGDRVVLSTQVGCGHCDYCRKGEFLFCSEGRVFGRSKGLNGGYGEYVLAPERACLSLPDEISYEVGVILPDGLGVPYHAIQRIGGINGREKVLVLGAGPIGLGTTILLKYYGAEVIVTDIINYRLNLAKQLGADYILNPKEKSISDLITAVTNGEGVDKAFDCASNTGETVIQAMNSIKRAGTVILIGQKENAKINPNYHIIWRQAYVTGSCAFNVGEWGNMLKLVNNGLAMKDLITHRFSFKETPIAFNTFDVGNTGKVIVLQKD